MTTLGRRPDDRWPRDIYSEAVWSSDLKPLERLVALAYADHAGSGETAWVSLPRLREVTGLSRDAANRAVRGLELAGWLVVAKPAAQHYSTVYRLVAPLGQQSVSRTPGPVDNSQQSASRTPQQSASRTADGPSSTPRDASSPSPDTSSTGDGPHSSIHCSDHSSDKPEDEDRIDSGDAPVITDPTDHQPHSLAAYADRLRNLDPRVPNYSDQEVRDALDRLRASLDADEDTARAVLIRVVRKLRPNVLPRYIGTLADRGALRRFADDEAAQRRKQHKHDLAATVAQLRTGPECEHGEPGGAALHPEAGTPLCPSCRRLAAVSA